MSRDPLGRLDAALDMLVRDHGVRVRQVMPLPRGLVNLSYRLDTSAGDLVLRIAAGRDVELVVDRQSEYASLLAAAGAGLAPEVIACDPQSGILVTRYAAPGAWSRDQARSPAGLRALGRWFAALHRVPPPEGCRVVDAPATCATYVAELAARPGGVGDLTRRLRDAEAAAAALGPPRVTVLCHNDLHHLNIVGPGDRPQAVDWEYAGRGDARLDLGQFALAHDLDARARRTLLDACDGSDGRVDPAELEVAVRLAAALNAAWAAVAGVPAR